MQHDMNSAQTAAELARLSELIDIIYQGATDPSRWNAILPLIANWIDAPKGALFTLDQTLNNNSFYFEHGLPEPYMQIWSTRFSNKDIWAIRGVERGLVIEGNVLTGEDILPFEELSRSEIYQEFLSKYDVAHLLTSIVFGSNSLGGNPFTVCAWYRSLKESPFSSFERDRLALLLPHLSRSLAVMTRLRGLELKTAASMSALDRLNSGVLLFGIRGQLIFANRVARRILEEEDGLQLRHRFGDSSLGEIIAESSSTQTMLDNVIRSAVSPDIMHAAHFSRAATIPRTSGRQDYMLNFSSLAEQNEFGSGVDTPRAIAFITDTAEPIVLDNKLLTNTYGLTPAELRVTEMIVECLTVEETADRLGVGKSTIKSQLQNIYAKTNTNNRAKLMKLILSLMQHAT